MDKQLHNKGFTLVEVLIVSSVIFMIVLSVALPISSYATSLKEHTEFQYCQLEAMANQTRCIVNDTLWFNKNGNINRAQTVQFGRKTCVFQLGFGRFKCETP